MSKLEELIQKYCPDGVEYVKIQDVCDVFTGGEVPEGSIKGGTPQGEIKYPIWGNGKEVYGYAKTYKISQDAVCVSSIGANTGDVFFHRAFFTPIIRLKVLIPQEERLSVRFLYYALSSVGFEVKKSSVPNMNANEVKQKAIPLPPLPVQEEIVRILDTFSELQEGLIPTLQAELQKRLQQYNYYRDNLLTNFTPDKQVKEYSLGELGTITRGNGLQKKDFTETGVGCIHYGQIYTRYGAFTEKTLTYVDDELASHLLQVEKGDLVIACTSENVEDICKCVAWLGEENICTGGHACVFRHKQNPKYISYFFQTEYFFNQKVKYTYGTKVKDIKPESLAKIKILLPSLDEQERIVSILDNLYTLTNDLTAGLPAEIEKRRQQYEFYRDKLLTFKRKES